MRLLLFFAVTTMTAGSAFAGKPRTIYVSEAGGKTFYQGKSIRAEEFLTGIRKARSGDTVIVLPGTYRKQYIISKQAEPSNPITISGTPGLTTFACADLPENRGDSPLKFSVARGLIIENFKFESCWPSPVLITDSTFLTFRRNAITGGYNAFRIAEQSSHSIKIDDNSWNQDPSYKLLWETNPAGVANGNTLKDFQGAFVHGDGVLGNLIITNNTINHSYGFFGCTNDPRHRLPTTNILIQGNKADFLRGEFININCPVVSLQISDNAVNHFGLFINNQSSIESSTVWGNKLSGTGGTAPNFVIANKGEFIDFVYAHNAARSVNHFFAFGNKGTYKNTIFTNNDIQLTESEPNWNDAKNNSNVVFRSNSVNPKLPKGVKLSGNKSIVGSGLTIPPLPTSLGQWKQLVGGPKLLLMAHTTGAAQATFRLSGTPPKSMNTIVLRAIDRSGQNVGEIKCKVDKKRLAVNCQLPKNGAHQIGFSSKIIDEFGLVLWPSNTQLTIYQEGPKREGFLNFQ